MEECAPNLLDLSEVSMDPTCNRDPIAFIERLISEVFCRQDYLEAVISNLTAAGCDENTVQESGPICNANANSQYCLFQHETPFLITAASLCNGATDRCNPACIEALNNATSAVGCCYTFLTAMAPSAWLSYSFWQQCGLVSPRFCEPRLIPVAAMTTTNTARDSTEISTEISKAALVLELLQLVAISLSCCI